MLVYILVGLHVSLSLLFLGLSVRTWRRTERETALPERMPGVAGKGR